ncbi:hypothetical protein [Alteraurantiacibacter palmitatis]|uniref:DUF4417 domain-containing protein n=1 Tax=Alteraurantiacibacter palmitatis TaxID=2054628 RepID=A0ABV7E578_9SPHN
MKNANNHSLPRLVRNAQSLWDDAATMPSSLGCVTCIDRPICGGVHNGASFFDCGDYCRCKDKATCDLVCRGKPKQFVERLREVGGLEFANVPRAQVVPIEALPPMVPLIDHATARVGTLNSPIVALPLYALLNIDAGTLRYPDRAALSQKFGIDPNARLVVSGVARDRKIERYWASNDRPVMLEQLAALDIALITPPNFSVLTDVPRTDNLHAMKRILMATVEMMQAGLPTALHPNARTERDYERWGELIAERPEIQYLAFEFATGAGRGERLDWHVAQLTALAARVPQPLGLVVRGGMRALEPLRAAFAAVTMIDSDAFTKTRCRQEAQFRHDGKLVWHKHPTPPGAPIDALLQQNVAALHSHHIILARTHAEKRRGPWSEGFRAPNRADRQALEC